MNRETAGTLVSRMMDASRYYASFLSSDFLAAYLHEVRDGDQESRNHLEAAMRWLCRAQDVSGNGGVARSYSLVYKRIFGRKGWLPSYPETTGYIIPTMFDYAYRSGDQEYFDRAVRMADWECEVQLDSGAIQSGTVEHAPNPAIFNTGQVIFGWIRAFQETKDEKYHASAVKAGDYLVSQQDDDGAWRKNLSTSVVSTMPQYTYNTRTAWALLLLSSMDDSRSYRDAALRNIDFSLTEQQDTGYFRNNCLNDPDHPLLHTIAYCLRGILESGIHTGKQEYLDRARFAVDRLLGTIREDGSMSGRFDRNWKPCVPWTCLTGNAQLSIVLCRLFQATSEGKYLDAAKRLNGFLRAAQLLDTGNPDLRGGMPGSYPIHGDYGKYEILSWAVKFFADALMLETEVTEGA